MDVLFLDANVLFSAAYKHDANFLKLWRMRDVRLISSLYAAGEAQRNFKKADQHDRLENLLKSVDFVPATAMAPLPEGVDLPAKDAPILISAIAGGATHLLTGDTAHFGAYYETAIEGVLILSPASYFLARPV